MKEQHQVLEGYIWWNNYYIPVQQFEQQLFGEEDENKNSSFAIPLLPFCYPFAPVDNFLKLYHK